MLTYWAMFIFSAFPALSTKRGLSSIGHVLWIMLMLLWIIIIGLRHKVGGDWESYLFLLYNYSAARVDEILSGADPGYAILNWVMGNKIWSIYLVNTVCAIIVIVGLSVFSLQQTYPWLALLVATPYFLIVVSMGYTRQATAIGLLMISFYFLRNGRLWAFLCFVSMATVFHVSAFLILSIALLAHAREKRFIVIGLAIVSFLIFVQEIAARFDLLTTNYLLNERSDSVGAVIRVAITSIAAIIYIFYNKKFGLTEIMRKFWWWVATLTVVLFPITSFATTAVDRVVLYFFPLQIVVFGNLPLLARGVHNRFLVNVCVIGFYGVILFVWLSFADTAFAWLPYQNAIFLR